MACLHSLRVEWAEKMAEVLAAELMPDYPVDTVITVGWPSKGSRRNRQGRMRAGECAMGVFDPQIEGKQPRHFISLHPSLFRDPMDVAHVLLHEMIHAVLGSFYRGKDDNGMDCWKVRHPGHKGEFVKMCKAVGLVKPWTATTPGDTLKARLKAFIESLGVFPAGGAELSSAKKKQGIRQVLAECSCGRKIRASRKTFEEGPVVCGLCHAPFEQIKK